VTGPVCLVVLDGFGIGEGGPGDAIAQSKTPFFDRLDCRYPRARLGTSGAAVGLPEGQMGNSEVGHMTLGAGRIIDHDLVRIEKALRAGAPGPLAVLEQVAAAARTAGGEVHLLGLVSDGGVHSSLVHLDLLLGELERRGLRPVLHAITDGRDTSPRSALRWLPALEARLRAAGGCVATVSGRFFAMDRDARWERVARAYRAIAFGESAHVAHSAAEAVEKAYGRNQGDEFIEPTLIANTPRLGAGSAALFFNFRADRARELSNALTRVQPQLLGPEIAALAPAPPAILATLTCYDESFGLPLLFPPLDLRGGLPELVSAAGLRQLRIAETEKYAHVTYFFNGGEEAPLPGEDRLLIPSPRDVATYDEKPQMSACELTDALLAALARESYAFVLVNYANPDMVGHTGVLSAAIEAVETVDACLARLAEAVLARGGSLLVTADHGNIEQLLDASGEPHTAHTTNPVPLWWIAEPPAGRLRDGGLADIAPTLCALLGLQPSPQMSGTCLIEREPASRSC
jgi:2,3-bisphosphoglycerate-independent phosphoglycerate mutase